MAIDKILYVLTHSKAKKSHQLVLIRIADHTNEEGLAWPSIRRLARETGLSHVWVIKIIADLQAVGELEVLPNASPKGTNAYRIPTGKVSLPRMKSSGKLSLHKVVNSVNPNLSYESLYLQTETEDEDRWLTHDEAVQFGLTPGSRLYRLATGEVQPGG